MPGGTAGEVDQETGEGGVVYGVTVTRPDGTAVDVRLDNKDFHVLDTQPPVITTTTTATTNDGPVEG